MLKATASFLISVLIIFGAANTPIAVCGSTDYLEARTAELSPNAQVCTGSGGVGCITISISSEASCVNFSDQFSILKNKVSSAVIPPGFACTFYTKFNCLSEQGGADQVILQGGTWDFFKVPGTAAPTINFSNIPNSFICTPVSGLTNPTHVQT